MRVPGRLAAVMLFAGISLLALVVSGLLDWVASSLFLVLEFLAGFLRRLFGMRPAQGRRARARPEIRLPLHASLRQKRPGSRGLSSRKRSEPGDGTMPAPAALGPEVRVLLPIGGDDPGLIEFALAECRSRKGELIVLLLRVFAVTPMGPNPLPGLDEDLEARTLFEALARRAEEAGVPLRILYEVTNDRTTSIIEAARRSEADVLLIHSTRRGRLWKALAGDMTQAILSRLPERVSLMIHAS